MKVYLTRKKGGVNATGNFDLVSKELIVLKGSVLSSTVSHTAKFRGAKSIEKSREGILKDNILQVDVVFKSASTAANFVTGISTNGLTAWKDEKGRTIKEIVAEGD